MFELFTTKARRVVVLSQEEARRLGHSHIGNEHILLGLIHEDGGVAGQALQAAGVSLDQARTQVEEIIGRGSRIERTTSRDNTRFPLTGQIPFTPRSKKVLELAEREAQDLGHAHIGTEHILLGLMREGDGVGAQMLAGSGIEFASIRHQIRKLMPDRDDDDLQPAEVPAGPGPSGPSGPAEQPGPPSGESDELTSRLASVAARLTAIEQRLRDSASGT
jgi:ATP-dependent Clp protease ATP-binding subunit ClpC